MLRSGLAVLITIALMAQSVNVSGEQPKPTVTEGAVTQGEFASRLVAALGWRTGLPEEPKEKDYLAILSGKRNFRFEAEETYNATTDNVTIRGYSLYGPFSGQGWLSGVADTTEAHFTVFIPRDGEYLFKVAAKGDGQKWSLAGRDFTVSAKGLSEAVAGTVHLRSGSHIVTAVIPPEGGVDYLAFEAPAQPAIEPLGGWRFAAPLKMGDVAEVAAALLGLDRLLPDDTSVAPLLVSVADVALFPPSAQPTTIGYLGTFLSKSWVRADFRDARLEIPLRIKALAVYGIRVRYLGELFNGELDGEKLGRPGKPYLDWVELGLFRLAIGERKLVVQLPPSGGIDVGELRRKKSSPTDYMTLAGFTGDPAATVDRAALDSLLLPLVARFQGRK
jgi:hypothetical protein